MSYREVIDLETGKQVRLWSTIALENDLTEHYKTYNCAHGNKRLRRYAYGSGNHYHEQCQDCGQRCGGAKPKASSPPETADADLKLASDYDIRRRTDYENLIQKHVKIQLVQSARHSKEYLAYLESREWDILRKKVVGRAKGVCEGCMERSATQAHHLTYDHLFEEFVFELVAVCDLCHERLHPPAKELAEEEYDVTDSV